MFLNKSFLLAAITSVPARINFIPADTGTRSESLILARMEFRYIPSINDKMLKLCFGQSFGKVASAKFWFQHIPMNCINTFTNMFN